MAKSRRFVITFGDHYPMEGIDLMRESNFISFGKVVSAQGSRVLYLYPRQDLREDVLKETLDELQDGGALRYVEEFQ